MDDIDIYFDSALKKDAKLLKFIQVTLEDGPSSDSDEDKRIESLSFMPPTSSDSSAVGTEYGSSSVERAAPVKMDQSLEWHPFDTSTFEVSMSDDNLPDLTFHFVEPNDFEKDCVSAHVKRLRRELEEAAKRKAKRYEQPEQRQFTGKPIEAVNSIRGAMKPKRLRRQRKKPFGLEEKSNDT